MEAYQSEGELRWTPLCLYFPNALCVTFASLFKPEYQCEDGHGGPDDIFSHKSSHNLQNARLALDTGILQKCDGFRNRFLV
jgi:hypothetical protein